MPSALTYKLVRLSLPALTATITVAFAVISSARASGEYHESPLSLASGPGTQSSVQGRANNLKVKLNNFEQSWFVLQRLGQSTDLDHQDIEQLDAISADIQIVVAEWKARTNDLVAIDFLCGLITNDLKGEYVLHRLLRMQSPSVMKGLLSKIHDMREDQVRRLKDMLVFYCRDGNPFAAQIARAGFKDDALFIEKVKSAECSARRNQR